jgi:hypothetical protein
MKNAGSRRPEVSKTSLVTEPSPAPPAWATGEGAWPLLAAGQLRSAAARFAVAALERPGESDARVGYALAKAAGGNLAEAAWALRRAFLGGNDVATLSAVHPETVNLARDLIVRYDTASPSSTAQRIDFDFAPVALAYLAGDARSAAKSAAMLEPDCLAEGTVANLRRLTQIELTAVTASERD